MIEGSVGSSVMMLSKSWAHAGAARVRMANPVKTGTVGFACGVMRVHAALRRLSRVTVRASIPRVAEAGSGMVTSRKSVVLTETSPLPGTAALAKTSTRTGTSTEVLPPIGSVKEKVADQGWWKPKNSSDLAGSDPA